MAGFADLIPECMPYMLIDNTAGAVGATWEIPYGTFVDNANTPVDFTAEGCSGEATIKAADGTVIAAPAVTFPAAGQILLTVEAATTDAVTPGTYLLELAVSKGSDEIVICGGGDSKFVVKRKVRA